MDKFSSWILVAALLLSVTACNEKMCISNATFHRLPSEVVRVEVEIDSNSASFIVEREIYVSIDTHECETGDHRFPAEAFAGESAVSNFDFSTSQNVIVLHGEIPASVFDRYGSPCVRLNGASYLGDSISSDPVVLKQALSAESD